MSYDWSKFVPYEGFIKSSNTVEGDLDISVLLGKTVIAIHGLEQYSDQVIFECSDDNKYIMWHEQDCCENVAVEDVVGDVNVLLNSPIKLAEVSSNNNHDEDDEDESKTWTFYKLGTINGYVTIRWLGESNGCYSEEVTFSNIIRLNV